MPDIPGLACEAMLIRKSFFLLTFKQRDDDQHHGHRRRHLEAEERDLEEAVTSDSSTHNLRDNAGSVQWRQHCRRRTKSMSSEAILSPHSRLLESVEAQFVA